MVCERKIVDYLISNFYITTSGYFNISALMHTLTTMGLQRLLFSADYPYESTAKANAWFEHLAMNPEDKFKIAYGNAEKLLFKK